MSLEFFLTNQAQITITMIPMFLCSYAKKNNNKKNKETTTTTATKKDMQTPVLLRGFSIYINCRWSHLHI